MRCEAVIETVKCDHEAIVKVEVRITAGFERNYCFCCLISNLPLLMLANRSGLTVDISDIVPEMPAQNVAYLN